MLESEQDLSILIRRLAQLEAERKVRNCINRYMEICDSLNADTNLDELMNLFDQDCIWEGIGKKYAQSFGRFDSWQAVYNMFKSYTQKESHFVLNAHFVNSEQMEVNQDTAIGRWLMLQSSTFQGGLSHLNAAKLTVQFKKQMDGSWKIKHFQTENIFSRPVDFWHSEAELPVPTTNK